MSPMLSAAYYTRHNTEIFFLIFFAALALAALIDQRVRSRRHRELPYGIRPITVYEPKLDQWPMPGSYDDIMSQVAVYSRELGEQLITEWIEGEMSTWPMVDAWKLMEPDFQTENV